MPAIVPKKTVIITGGAGFIGANLIRKLLTKKYNVHVIFRKSTNLWRLKDIQNKIDIHYVSLLDKRGLEKLFKTVQPKIIFHLATYSSYRNQSAGIEMIKTNIMGTFNLLDASKDINYDIFVNTGSSSEY